MWVCVDVWHKAGNQMGPIAKPCKWARPRRCHCVGSQSLEPPQNPGRFTDLFGSINLPIRIPHTLNVRYQFHILFSSVVLQVWHSNRFGAVCAQAKEGPVFIEKDGRIDSVILSMKQYELLKAPHDKPSLDARQTQFELTHKAWLAEQNQRFETHGVWCDDLRTW